MDDVFDAERCTCTYVVLGTWSLCGLKTLSISHMPNNISSLVGLGEEGHTRILNWSMGITEKAAPVTATTLRTRPTGPVPEDSPE